MWLDNLKRKKAESGKTTAEISAASGIPVPTLEKIFSGATKDPKLETMRAVCQAIGCTLDDLAPVKETEPAAQPLTVDALAELLEGAGLLRPGADLTEEDFRFLSAVAASIAAWFN